MQVAVDIGGDLEHPLLAQTNAQRKPVQVYHPYGKEVVDTAQDSRCLSGLLGTCAPSGDMGADAEVMWTIRSSVWINFGLFICKLYAFYASGSLAVLASLVDSTIDLVGQGVLMWTKQLASTGGRRDDYPIGRERLEPVGVMVCAVVMGMASIEVITTCSKKIIKYYGHTDVPYARMDDSTVFMLLFITGLKAVLYIWCSRVSARHPNNDSVKAIAQDNQNDVISNFAALLAPEARQLSECLWLADPIAGIVISIYIIYTWISTGYEQVEMIVGKRADPETLRKIQSIAEEMPSMQLDQLCAYHFGPRYLVEIEVVMPESTTLRESHDEGIKLQHKIEMLEDVERCFVHIDYQLRECDDHDPEVPIEAKLYGGPRPGSPRASHGAAMFGAES